jgi:hypothetical protein
LRNFARNSWIPQLPQNVCNLFLYDDEESIDVTEKYDGISLNSKYRGWNVRRGEKLYKFYDYVSKNEKLNNLKYIAKMDDDVVLCPEIFQFLKSKGISLSSYVGWFWNLEKAKNVGISESGTHSDEMFVILGRTLMNEVISKEYCDHTNEKQCDSLHQLFDTNLGGRSLGLWLSFIKDVHVLPLNDVAVHGDAGHKSLKKNVLLYHLTRKYNEHLSLMQHNFLQCRLTNERRQL